MPPVVTLASKKGGVGKTTTAVNLGSALARPGRRTLVLDLDSQANATYVLGDPDTDLSEAPTFAGILADPTSPYPVLTTPEPNLDLVPGNDELLGLGDTSRPEHFAAALDPLAGSGRWDVIVADSEPRLGATTLSAMSASALVLVPTTPELFAIAG